MLIRSEIIKRGEEDFTVVSMHRRDLMAKPDTKPTFTCYWTLEQMCTNLMEGCGVEDIKAVEAIIMGIILTVMYSHFGNVVLRDIRVSGLGACVGEGMRKCIIYGIGVLGTG